MAIDLTAARNAVGRIFSDTCIVRRPTSRKDGKTFDKTTGTLTVALETLPTVYKGVLLVLTSPRVQTTPGLAAASQLGLAASTPQYELRFPHTAPEFRPGDLLSVVKSVDKQLTGKTMIMRDIAHTSMLVWREVSADDWETSRG